MDDIPFLAVCNDCCDRWVCYAAARASWDGRGSGDAHVLRRGFGRKHDHRIRWNLDRWYSQQRERRERSTGGGEGFSSCPNYGAPNLTMSNGLAQLDVTNVRFQGYVTPQGALAMRTGAGHRFEGQIDSQNMLRGRVIGARVYDATWRRSA